MSREVGPRCRGTMSKLVLIQLVLACLGFISDATDPYAPLSAAIERARGLLKEFAMELLARIRGGPVRLRLIAVTQVLRSYNVPIHLTSEILRPLTIGNLERMMQDLESLIAAMPDPGASLAHCLLKADHSRLVFSRERYRWLNLEAQMLNYVDETGNLQNQAQELVASMHGAPIPRHLTDRMYKQVKGGDTKAYVEISEVLLKKFELKRMRELDPYISRPSSSSTCLKEKLDSHRKLVGIEAGELAELGTHSDWMRVDMENAPTALRERIDMLKLDTNSHHQPRDNNGKQSRDFTSISGLDRLGTPTFQTPGGRCSAGALPLQQQMARS
ncbi:hypothetical protein SeLEV6574_g03692 [Synchytrium endobioticum]|uniref:Uncharacterized protein n=1 Tax=Synchytrium endobioticum TaxID=286115 RepID=A0A507D360_9FUNG|nr:hypothetical protein SeLEV6574_g03692 [Synchytrium endobioticum]